jgi:hypothetical protein
LLVNRGGVRDARDDHHATRNRGEARDRILQEARSRPAQIVEELGPLWQG